MCMKKGRCEKHGTYETADGIGCPACFTETHDKEDLADELAAAAKAACLNFERQRDSGNFLGDDDNEVWGKLSDALTKWKLAQHP